MTSRTKRATLALTTMAAAVGGFSVALYLILRYQPKPFVRAVRTIFGRVLNPIVISISDRFELETGQQALHHIGRRTGREYRTPLCVVPTPEGYIVPAAFGPDVDWLANLRTTPQAQLTYKRTTYPVIAEVIDRKEAYRLAGGSAGCPCWDQFRIQDFAILRPDGNPGVK